MMAPLLTDRLGDLGRALARARDMIADGGTIDLSGLDDQIARILDAAPDAPSTARDTIRAALEALRDQIDGLGIELHRRHDAETARRAAGAYAAGAVAS